jgi:hypothetical protein
MMDILGWLGWLLWGALALLWSIVWLLLGGWISTLAQIVVVLMAIFVYRYGWQQAPAELWRQTLAVWRFATGAMRASEALSQAEQDRKRSAARERPAPGKARARGPRHAGDVTINLSTALSVGMLAALWLVSLAL